MLNKSQVDAALREIKRMRKLAGMLLKELQEACPHPKEADVVGDDPHSIACGWCGRWLDDGRGNRLNTKKELRAWERQTRKAGL